MYISVSCDSGRNCLPEVGMFSSYKFVCIFQYPVIAVETAFLRLICLGTNMLCVYFSILCCRNCLPEVGMFSGYYVVCIFQYPVIAVETAFLRLVCSVSIMLCVYFRIL